MAKGFRRLPGFRDFAPEDFAARAHVFEVWRRVSRCYGFAEYDGPPLEPLDLYVEKSGREIVGQLYSFRDKGERDVSLRPEMTPSLARILAERSRSLPKPIRWFSVPQLFRYERQQRGRLREHFQWNVDIVGEEAVAADAEILAVALDGLRELGLTDTDVRARVSDRRLLTALLRALGVGEAQTLDAFTVIDKLEFEDPERSRERLANEVGMSPEGAAELLSLLAGGLGDVSARFPGRADVTEAEARLREYVAMLEAMGLGAYVELDLRIVRGLAYYTGIVFEIFDRRRGLRAICGGGRYDRLFELVGGSPLPAVGFGMGDVVLTELLREHALLPDATRSVDYYVVPVSAEERPRALELAHALRVRGRSVTYSLRQQSVGKQFKMAAAQGARRVIVLGPAELERGMAVLRDMTSGEECDVDLEELVEDDR
ncbi:MAG: histidine--tRNA ligase [Gemmatimonadota bacterium]|nr:histidine--tRNA ligase [Gemmatimonadota bacterium]